MSNTLAYITWNPSLGIEIGGHLIRWYSLLFGLTVFYCGLSGRWFFAREHAPLDDFLPVIGVQVVCGLIGARIAHVFFYDWPYFSQHPAEIFSIWHGGLASHGGAVGLVLGLYLYSRYLGQTYYWWLFDRLAVGLPLGAFFIRIGNLFNSELYGKATDAPWAFVFSQVDNIPRHPVQLYEAAFYLLLSTLMFWLLIRKGKPLHFGTLSGIFLLAINGFRFLIEFLKESPTVFVGLNTSQLLSIPFIVGSIVLLWLSAKGKFD